ncbi:MAG TPA: hypothetical protein VLM76_06395 [Patescibacteria group bacterium]|nr:hypothetical protein [Patescibacteria group bacterium]
MTDPTTESASDALRRLVHEAAASGFSWGYLTADLHRRADAAIAAVEAEAVALERARIAAAVCELWDEDADFDDIAILRIVNPEADR